MRGMVTLNEVESAAGLDELEELVLALGWQLEHRGEATDMSAGLWTVVDAQRPEPLAGLLLHVKTLDRYVLITERLPTVSMQDVEDVIRRFLLQFVDEVSGTEPSWVPFPPDPAVEYLTIRLGV